MDGKAKELARQIYARVGWTCAGTQEWFEKMTAEIIAKGLGEPLSASEVEERIIAAINDTSQAAAQLGPGPDNYGEGHMSDK